jgi:thioesterase domain-containing protein
VLIDPPPTASAVDAGVDYIERLNRFMVEGGTPPREPAASFGVSELTVGPLARALEVPRDPDLSRVQHLLHMHAAHLEALRNYRPGEFTGQVVVFRPGTTERGSGVEHEQFGGRDVPVVRTPGDHQSMLREPAVTELARQLQALLDAAAVARVQDSNTRQAAVS